MNCSQLVHRLGQSIWDCSALSQNLRNNLSSSLGWVSHNKCTNVYDYTLNKTYGKSLHKLLGSYDFIKLLYCINSQSWYNIKLLFMSLITLIYGWDPKVVIYSYRLSHYWLRHIATNILKTNIIISHGFEIVCHLEWFSNSWSWNLCLE